MSETPMAKTVTLHSFLFKNSVEFLCVSVSVLGTTMFHTLKYIHLKIVIVLGLLYLVSDVFVFLEQGLEKLKSQNMIPIEITALFTHS